MNGTRSKIMEQYLSIVKAALDLGITPVPFRDVTGGYLRVLYSSGHRTYETAGTIRPRRQNSAL